MLNNVFVSVCMITYGHENFITQAIKSVLSQKTNFKFELIISNDNSPDKSDTKIQEFLNDKRIVYIKNDINIGAMENYLNVLKLCNGKYIAICEGDDYWVDENKLQSQYDFLESNLQYVSCGSQIYSINDLAIPKYTKQNINYNQGKTYTYTDLALTNRISFVTAFFRNNLSTDKLEIIKNSPHGDWPTHIAISENDSSLYFVSDRITSVYRLHEGGIYSLQKIETKKVNTAKTLFALNTLTQNKFEIYYFLLSLYLMKNWNERDIYLSEKFPILFNQLKENNFSDSSNSYIKKISDLILINSNIIQFCFTFNRLYKSNINIKIQIAALYQELKPSIFCLLFPSKLNYDYWIKKF